MSYNVDGKTEYTKEEKLALSLLKDPNLFTFITESELSKKIEGEKESIKVIFLSVIGKNVKNAKLTSYNILINAESSAGKDHLVTKVLEIFPKDILINRSRISPTTLTYWHCFESEPEWTWDGKVLYLEDAGNNILNSEVVKVFCSSETKSTIIVNNKAKDFTQVGKPILVITSASGNLHKENLRRFSVCDLDETDDQTKGIKRRQAEEVRTGIRIDYESYIIKAMGMLKDVKVVIPFATNKLADSFPNNIIIRTNFPKFLDYIKASACLHQYQRDRNKKGEVIATKQDYEIAREVFNKIVSNPFMIPLTMDLKSILNKLKELKEKEQLISSYSVSELMPYFSWTDKWLKRQLDKLVEYGFLKRENEEREGVKQKVMCYQLKEICDIKIPSWEDICKNSSDDTNDSIDTPHPLDTNNSNDSKDNKNGTTESSEHGSRASDDPIHKETEEEIQNWSDI